MSAVGWMPWQAPGAMHVPSTGIGYVASRAKSTDGADSREIPSIGFGSPLTPSKRGAGVVPARGAQVSAVVAPLSAGDGSDRATVVRAECRAAVADRGSDILSRSRSG